MCTHSESLDFIHSTMIVKMLRRASASISLTLILLGCPLAHGQVKKEPEVSPPAPQALKTRAGKAMTIRWQSFGSDKVELFRLHGKVQVVLNGHWIGQFDSINKAMRKAIEYTVQDADIDSDVETFVKDASQLPLNSRFGVKNKPIALDMPYGVGINVDSHRSTTLYLCEVIEADRQAMHDADQRLSAFGRHEAREMQKVQAAHTAAAAEVQQAYAAQWMARAQIDSANSLRGIWYEISNR